MHDFWTAFLLVFASEMGDKSQVVSFSFGTRHSLIIVLPAIFLGIAMMLLCSALIGHVVGHWLPYFWLNILAGALFLIFGYLSLIGQHEDIHKPVGTKFGAFITVLLTFVISELGDKTIFATMTLASQSKNFWGIWAGSTLGMFTADLLAIAVGTMLGRALPARATAIGSAMVFFAAGAWTIFQALKGST